MARAKKQRIAERRRQQQRLKMTVVSAEFDHDDVTSLAHETQQCHAAMLYADEVTLVSPRAALLQTVFQAPNAPSRELLKILADAAPRYFPELADRLRQKQATLEGYPARSSLDKAQRKIFDQALRQLAEDLEPVRQKAFENSEEILSRAGFGELQLAVDAGVLTIDPLTGADVGSFDDKSTVDMMIDLLNEIQRVLESGIVYPLFGNWVSNIVRLGVEAELFKPIPQARRLGGDAAMAEGLFDRLPNFPHATTKEILDVRSLLASPLTRFRVGVRELSKEVELNPEDPQYGMAVEDAWNLKVSPALLEIEDAMLTNTSLKNLAARSIRDPAGLATLGGAAALPATLAVAAGPATALSAVAAFAVGLSATAVRGLLAQGDTLREATNSQLYFLYGANGRIGQSE
jgi:hypothetical protein